MLLLAVPGAAGAETWLVYPVRAEHPPPRDPTMLRMSVELARSISEVVTGHVRLAKRDERDQACPLSCPPEVAAIQEVDHVVELVLGDAMDELVVRVFRRRGDVLEGKVPCEYGGGAVACDAKRLQKMLGSQKGDAPLDAEAVKSGFAALRPKLLECGEPKPKVRAKVRFRVRPDGRVTDVRISPKKVQFDEPYACMARVVESLRVVPFAGERPVAFSMPLPKAR